MNRGMYKHMKEEIGRGEKEIRIPAPGTANGEREREIGRGLRERVRRKGERE